MKIMVDQKKMTKKLTENLKVYTKKWDRKP